MKEIVPGRVYKSCVSTLYPTNHDQYVLIMQKIDKPDDVDSDSLKYLPDNDTIYPDRTFEKNGAMFAYPQWTITNESRCGVLDPVHAKFRGTVFKILFIINKQTGQEIQSILAKSQFSGDSLITLYEVGKNIFPNCYDCQKDLTCAHGIHFFNDFETAYFYSFRPIIKSLKYTGPFKEYCNDGSIYLTVEYKDGELDGPAIEHDTGTTFKGNYSRGLREGEWVRTCVYTNLTEIQYYKDGELTESPSKVWGYLIKGFFAVAALSFASTI
jgi:hypothetical protein